MHQPYGRVRSNAASVKELQRIAGNKRFIKNQWLTEERIIFKTVFLKIKACDLCSFIYGFFKGY